MRVTFYEVFDARTIPTPPTWLHLYVLAEPVEPLTLEEHPGVALGQQGAKIGA